LKDGEHDHLAQISPMSLWLDIVCSSRGPGRNFFLSGIWQRVFIVKYSDRRMLSALPSSRSRCAAMEYLTVQSSDVMRTAFANRQRLKREH